MANKEHVEIVKQGAEAISQWREGHPGEQLDLSGATLRRASLEHADLREANLRGADLEWADCRWSDFVGADLSGATLKRADLFKADLQKADLRGADLSGTNLEDAVLQDAVVAETIFSHTRMLNTDLSNALGLERTVHPTISEFDPESENKSGDLPNHFLMGCGRNMPFKATVYRVLIGSPSDVKEEREMARDTVYQWNDRNSKSMRAVLLPVLWETHSTPRLGKGRAQTVLNEQIVEPSQILVVIFWHRLGTPTDEWESGTVEEIERFLSKQKPVLAYFCDRPVPQDIDQEEWRRFLEFKKKIMAEGGLVREFTTPKDLADALRDHLTATVRELLGPTPGEEWRR
jgi:hypothetical protein